MRRRNFVGMTAGMIVGGWAEPGKACASVGELAAFAARRRYAKTPFGQIAFIDDGDGPVALFLHGFPLDSFQWRGAIARLRGHRRCIAPDFMGLGHTEVAEGQSLAPAAQAAMLIALLDRLAVRDADLIANDSGGAVAQILLARHPSRVRTLLLTNCDTEHDSPPPALLPVIELARAGRFVDEMLGPQLADKAVVRSRHGIATQCYADAEHPTDEAVDCYFGPLLSAPHRKALGNAYAVALERNPLLGIEKDLRRSAVPARIVWGMADPIFSAASPDYLDRTFGASRGVRRLEGRKLFFPEEVPDVIASEALALWLGR